MEEERQARAEQNRIKFGKSEMTKILEGNIDKAFKDSKNKKEDEERKRSQLSNHSQPGEGEETTGYKVDLDPIYKETAFRRTVFVYEDQQNLLTPQSLVKIVMNMLQKEIKIQRQKIWAETLQKREDLKAKRLTYQKKQSTQKVKQGVQETVGSCGGLALDEPFATIPVTRQQLLNPAWPRLQQSPSGGPKRYPSQERMAKLAIEEAEARTNTI